jgi:hypothetical protein
MVFESLVLSGLNGITVEELGSKIRILKNYNSNKKLK